MKNIILPFFLLFFILGCSQRCPAPKVQYHEYEPRDRHEQKIVNVDIKRGEDRSGVDVVYDVKVPTTQTPQYNTQNSEIEFEQNLEQNSSNIDKIIIVDTNNSKEDNQNINQTLIIRKIGIDSVASKKLSSIYFDFNKYSIKDDMQNRITSDVKLLNSPENINANILLEGNCDELGSEQYNYNLGLKRANSVKSSLISLGINKNRIFVNSLGKTKPICQANSDKCHQKNRRVDLKLVKFKEINKNNEELK